MHKIGHIGLALLSCACSLYILPASASTDGATSGDLRPVAGKPVVYQSYISNEGCVTKKGSSPSFTGGSVFGISGYAADNTVFSKGNPLDLSCPEGYAIVQVTSQTSGGFGNAIVAGGGQVNNNGTAQCCPIKYRWVSPSSQ